MRSVWDAYYLNTDVYLILNYVQGLIFVIDSADFDNLEESKTEFYKLLSNEELKTTTVLVYANKQDLNNAKTVSELIQIYSFDKIKNHVWHIQVILDQINTFIQPCSAKTGEGLLAGLKWLSDQLVYKKNTRFPNNPYLTNGNTYIYMIILVYNKIEQDTGRSFSMSNVVVANTHPNSSNILEESKSIENNVEILDKDEIKSPNKQISK